MEDLKYLIEKVEKLTKLLEVALADNARLRVLLTKFEHPRNSKNSSIPPSKDENRVLPNQSLREKSGKNVGGQLGHKGYTLEMNATPTQTIALKSDYCTQCGLSLKGNAATLLEKRQVIEIPPIIPIITEYQSFSRICSCGLCNKAEFPAGVTSPIQYGSTIQSMATYLNVRQFMPFRRIKECFESVFDIHCSEGTIQNMLKAMAQKALPAYEIIKNKIENAAVLGGDETSCRIDGKKAWMWTLQNPSLTYIHCSDNRGFKTLNELFPNGLPKSILTHDAYSAWFKLKAKKHQLCLTHLQRDLNFLQETNPDCHWVAQIKQLFYDAIAWKKNPTKHPHTFLAQLQQYLKNLPRNITQKLKAFIKRLLKHQNSLFNFLDYQYLPPDNNGSERAIRNVKVKSKISGQFKSIENANIFAVLRTVIDTAIKNNQPVLSALEIIANFRTE